MEEQGIEGMNIYSSITPSCHLDSDYPLFSRKERQSYQATLRQLETENLKCWIPSFLQKVILVLCYFYHRQRLRMLLAEWIWEDEAVASNEDGNKALETESMEGVGKVEPFKDKREESY